MRYVHEQHRHGVARRVVNAHISQARDAFHIARLHKRRALNFVSFERGQDRLVVWVNAENDPAKERCRRMGIERLEGDPVRREFLELIRPGPDRPDVEPMRREVAGTHRPENVRRQ